MFGFENQSIEACLHDVEQAIALSPVHISFYQLTIEPNTFSLRE
jgi:oxygen-independent coproporphyrinogen-3 oxidase